MLRVSAHFFLLSWAVPRMGPRVPFTAPALLITLLNCKLLNMEKHLPASFFTPVC